MPSLLTPFLFSAFLVPDCLINAPSLVSISFHPSTTLLFLTPPGTSSPVSRSTFSHFEEFTPTATTNPYHSQHLAILTPPPPVLVLQLISPGTSSHPCHVWLLITLSPRLPTITPALPLRASHFQVPHQHPSRRYHPLQSFPLQTLALPPHPRIPLPSLGFPHLIPCPADFLDTHPGFCLLPTSLAAFSHSPLPAF